MKTFKSISIFFLLIVLTCGIVFVPPIISGQKEENIMNEVIHLNYSAGNRQKLTSEQVARLYHNCEIGIGLNSFYTNGENSDTEIIRKDVLELIDMLFAENELIQNSVKNLLSNSELNYFRNSGLIKINNQPTAINFVSCGTENEKGYIKIDYEEKTKTIVQFSCYIFDEIFENFKETDFSLDGTSPIGNNYYKKQLNLSIEEYYFNFCIVPMDENKDSNHITKFYVTCGIVQQGGKEIYEVEQQKPYN